MAPLRLIQVGLGGWGQDWAINVVSKTSDVALVGLVDPRDEAVAQLQGRLHLPEQAYFASLDEAFAAVDADAVLITTALSGHVPVALAALQAGKHVLVEKPFAPSVAEAQQAVALAEQQDRVLMVSQNYRFYPAVRAVAAVLRAQPLGPINSVRVEFRKYANTAAPGTNRHYELVQPLLLDMAIHHFDLMRCVLHQEPTRVTCHAWNPSWSHFHDPAAAVATIEFDGGAVVNYSGSWVSTAPDTTWGGAWTIECEGGVISWTSRDDVTTNSDMVVVRPLRKRARRVTLPQVTAFDRAGTLAAFMAAVQNGTPPESSGRDNVGSLALTFATIAAAESGQPVELAAFGV